MLRQRVLSAIAFVPVVFAAIWFGEPWFTLALGLLALLGVLEFYRAVGAAGRPPLAVFGTLWTLAVLSSPHCPYPQALPLLVTGAVVLPLAWLTIRGEVEGALPRWTGTMAGILYIGWLLSYMVALRALNDGRGWIMLAVFATFAADTTAYFVGRAWGRRPMAPVISPRKSWEGAVAGFLAAVAAAFVLAALFGLPLAFWQTSLLGVLIGVVSQVGDLSESLIKRSAGIKDAGKAIPGHGGVLDRLDSILLVGVVVYYYAWWITR